MFLVCVIKNIASFGKAMTRNTSQHSELALWNLIKHLKESLNCLQQQESELQELVSFLHSKLSLSLKR